VIYFGGRADIGETDKPIPLPNVSGPILTKVIEWCTHHRYGHRQDAAAAAAPPRAGTHVSVRVAPAIACWVRADPRRDPAPPAEDENRERRTDDILEWDADFCKVDQGTLFELILAANYLDIKGLLDLTCKTVANMIKGKTPEEIRKTFNIKNDFTPEEEEIVRKENEWVEDRM